MSTAIVTDKKYTVDPLYQWDQGQVLEIRGLSMEKAPEIHFDNGSLSGAIVKQSEMNEAGIITVNIPNILLQKANKIMAYICISGVEEFKSLYAMEITVKARKKPEFYEVVDEYEIYSIQALTIEVENELEHLRTEYEGLNGRYEEIVDAIEEDRQILEEAIDTYNRTVEKMEPDIATTEKAGIVKPDGETIEIDEDGTMRVIGGGGVSDYKDIENKPKINGVELDGNVTLEDLDIPSEEDINGQLEDINENIESLETELTKTTAKVEIIANADLGIKETAIGEEIHLTDSADGKAVEYALYGKATQDGTPTPENPIDIVVAGASGSVKITSAGKNLWNPNGKSTNGSGVERSGIVVPKGTYTITNNSNVSAYCRDGINNTETLGTIASQKSSTFTFNLEGVYWISNNSVVTDIQVEKGAVATEFEPYKETLSTIPTPNGLAGIKVDSGGNYTDQSGQQWICDEVVKYADGSGAFVQRVGKETYENVAWENRNIVPPFGVYTYCWSTSKKNIPSNYNNPANGSEPILTSMGDKLYAGKNYLNIETNMTLEEFSNYMSSKALIVYYKLLEPIHTPLTAEQLADIETFYPITNITNDFDCGMKVKYSVDTKNYIDNKIAELATAMINNI